MAAYYNDNDPFVVAWLRELIKEGLIADGEVDDRSIEDVTAADLRGFTQCHFFAGIGGWSYALRLAGWPDDKLVWTGSCPCQDFSVIGKREGFDGNRDLWPSWLRLIDECRPDRLFGEQVDGAPEWLDRTASDLEALGYSCGSVVIPALACGAQHERLRVYFVADPHQARWANAQGVAAAKARADFWNAASMVRREATWNFQWPLEPDESWVVDGLSGEGDAVAALGNAIVPQVAAAFIEAMMDDLAP
jgi:DNA (cytosine-5)-methyltransferase 1